MPGDALSQCREYKYIGDAVDVAERALTRKLSSLKQTPLRLLQGKESHESGGDNRRALLSPAMATPVGQATSQLAMSIASKVDADSMDALAGKPSSSIRRLASCYSHSGIVDAVDKFNEELNTEKAMFINPHQNSQLRKDPNFISADKYDGNVVMTGEIGKIANCRIVPSKKVSLNEAIPEQYVRVDSDAEGTKEVVADSKKHQLFTDKARLSNLVQMVTHSR